MIMEAALNRLFDYQSYETNPALEAIINAVHSRYAGRELSLDDLDMVSAAGVPETILQTKESKDIK